LSSLFLGSGGKDQAHGGTVWKVRRLKVMSKESTARLKAMLSGLEKETFGLIISPWKR
jgi:hypothetical protein